MPVKDARPEITLFSIVRLKSGGPDMTVIDDYTGISDVEDLDHYGFQCIWFTKSKKARMGCFYPETLELMPGK